MLGDRDLEGLEKTKSLISTAYPDAKVEISPLDISDEAQVEEFFNLAVKHYGRIDFAASVAEIGQTPIPAHKLKGADFDRLYQFNQRGVRLPNLPSLHEKWLTVAFTRLNRPSSAKEP